MAHLLLNSSFFISPQRCLNSEAFHINVYRNLFLPWLWKSEILICLPLWHHFSFPSWLHFFSSLKHECGSRLGLSPWSLTEHLMALYIRYMQKTATYRCPFSWHYSLYLIQFFKIILGFFQFLLAFWHLMWLSWTDPKMNLTKSFPCSNHFGITYKRCPNLLHLAD